MTDTTPEQTDDAGQSAEEASPYPSNIKTQAKPSEPGYVPIPPPSRFKRVLRSTFRWISIALLGFLVGLAVMAYPVLHAQANLKAVEKERDQAQFTLTMQSKLLDGLQTDQARLVVVRALSEVRAAKLALDDNDEINLPLFLDKAAQVMKTIPTTLPTQQTTVTKIQQKLASAQEKAKSSLPVAKPELDQQLSDLIENLRNLDALLNPNP
jgi:hypothetical protein